jgi:hypothetical protein
VRFCPWVAVCMVKSKVGSGSRKARRESKGSGGKIEQTKKDMLLELQVHAIRQNRQALRDFGFQVVHCAAVRFQVELNCHYWNVRKAGKLMRVDG